jgi:hypothetical protein
MKNLRHIPNERPDGSISRAAEAFLSSGATEVAHHQNNLLIESEL